MARGTPPALHGRSGIHLRLSHAYSDGTEDAGFSRCGERGGRKRGGGGDALTGSKVGSSVGVHVLMLNKPSGPPSAIV